MSAGANLRYVSKSYLDHTNDRDFVAPAYFTADLDGSLALGAWIPAGGTQLRLQINILTIGRSTRAVTAIGSSTPARTTCGPAVERRTSIRWRRGVFVTLDFKM